MSSNSLESVWRVHWSDFGSRTIPNVLSIDKLGKSRFVIFGEMSSFGKVFKITVQLDAYFVR